MKEFNNLEWWKVHVTLIEKYNIKKFIEFMMKKLFTAKTSSVSTKLFYFCFQFSTLKN